MINRNDQHTRKPDPEQGERTGPVDFDQLLTIAARAGVPVMRAHRGRLEVHEPPQRAPRDLELDDEPRLAGGPAGGGQICLPPSPRFSSSIAPETAGRRRNDPETSGLERALTDLERSRKALRRRTRSAGSR